MGLRVMHACCSQKHHANSRTMCLTDDGSDLMDVTVLHSLMSKTGAVVPSAQPLHEGWKELFGSALRTITVMSYTISEFHEIAEGRLHRLAVDAMKRGVELAIYVHRRSDAEMIALQFSQAGCDGKFKFWYWDVDNNKPASLFHVKSIVVDARRAYVGSGNITNNAATNSAEFGIVVRSPEVAMALERYGRSLVDLALMKELNG